MNKYRYLFKNIGLLGLSNFGGKLLSFLLIPLYTSVLSTEEYGTFDFYVTTVLVLIPILTVSINDAILRFSISSRQDRETGRIFCIGVRYVIRSIGVFIVLVAANCLLGFVEVLTYYPVLLVLYMSANLVYDNLCQFARGVDRVLDFAIAGILNSVTMLLLNVVLLLAFDMGLPGFFWANILSYVIPVLFLAIRLHIRSYLGLGSVFHLDGQAKALRKEMTRYSKPMVFNTVAWWVINASDKYVVAWICGLAANGLYSVAYKIPSLINIVQSIFQQAWVLSAVKEFDGDNGKFYSTVYNLYAAVLVSICSFLILSDKLLARLLFANDFYEAWQYAPLLMIAVAFGSLVGFLVGIFQAAKKTGVIAGATCIGAVINLVNNFWMVWLFGPIGAAASTLLSYVIIWAIMVYRVNKLVKMDFHLLRDVLCFSLLLFEAVCLLFLPAPLFTAIGVTVVVFEVSAYFSQWKLIMGKVKQLIYRNAD